MIIFCMLRILNILGIASLPAMPCPRFAPRSSNPASLGVMATLLTLVVDAPSKWYIMLLCCFMNLPLPQQFPLSACRSLHHALLHQQCHTTSDPCHFLSLVSLISVSVVTATDGRSVAELMATICVEFYPSFRILSISTFQFFHR